MVLSAIVCRSHSDHDPSNPDVELARFYWAEAHAKLGLAHFRVGEFGRASGMQVVDLLEAWRAEGIDTEAYYLHDNAHLTGRGYGGMALRLADAIQPRLARLERPRP